MPHILLTNKAVVKCYLSVTFGTLRCQPTSNHRLSADNIVKKYQDNRDAKTIPLLNCDFRHHGMATNSIKTLLKICVGFN